jgi:hypothetical protein
VNRWASWCTAVRVTAPARPLVRDFKDWFITCSDCC